MTESELRSPNVLKVNDHIFLMDDHQDATWYVVSGKDRAVVIDTSVGMSNVRREAEKVTDRPLTLINTHGHGDHIGGNWSFEKAYMNPADLPVAEANLNRGALYEAREKYGLRFPDFEPLADGQMFDLGGVTLEVIFFPGHTPGEIVLLDREDRALFTGDGLLEHLWLQMDESLPVEVQIRSMERLIPLKDQFDMILHGHCRAPFGMELFDTLLASLRDLAAGNTANDIDYPWRDRVSRAYPYQPNDRRIVHK